MRIGGLRRKSRPGRKEVVVTSDGRTILRGKAYRRLRSQVYERDKGICAVCGRRVEWSDYEMDHAFEKDGTPTLTRGMGGSRRNDALECCRTTHAFCNRDRVRKERPVKI
jgi:5-methylcytosine-specific restriction endonuclease McrA